MSRSKYVKRRITVDAQEYRWVLSPDDGYMVLWVRLYTQPRQRLRANFLYHDIWIPSGPGVWHSLGQRCSITPKVVRAVILTGLAQGWQPTATKPAEFCLRDAEKLIVIEAKAGDSSTGPSANQS